MESAAISSQHRQNRTMGTALALTGAILWGLSGTVAQYLFSENNFLPGWLISVRLLTAGMILTSISTLKNKQSIWTIWKSKEDRTPLLLFGIFGMLSVQYTYFAAIDASNAATATFLQYLAPALITAYFVFMNRKLPKRTELIALCFALVGTFLLVTRGSLNSLSISTEALVWGIISAFSLAYYTIQPRNILRKWGSMAVTGWGMLIGGLFISIIHPPWLFHGTWSNDSLLFVFFVILFGTVIPFYCYLESLKYIKPSETSMLASIEPLTAAIVSVIWLKTAFVTVEWIGAGFILMTILLLSHRKQE